MDFAHKLFVAPTLLTLLMCALSVSGEWNAGVASVVITPSESMWMAGFASRSEPSSGVAQDLHAKALAIEDRDGTRLLIVTMDLISVPRTIRRGLERRLEDTFGLPPESLLLNASHTHSGPRIRVMDRDYEARDPSPFKGGNADEVDQQVRAYLRQLEQDLVEVASRALTGMRPAELSYGFARAGFAMNRRGAPGARRGPYPEGPVDHDVPVLQVTAADETVMAVLFGYACHNTTLLASSLEFHGDYAGCAQEFVEAAFPGAVALFMAGAGGDQNPIPRGGNVRGQSQQDLARQHGRSLANAVFAAMIAPVRPLHGPLKAALEYVEIEYEEVDAAHLEELARYGNGREAVHAAFVLEDIRKGRLASSYPYPVQVVRFGEELILVALAGEAVVDYSLRLKAELGPGPVWVAAYSNDGSPLYIPSRRVLAEGDYEGGGAQLLIRSVVHPARWAPTIEEKIIGAVHRLEERLRAGADGAGLE